MVTAERGQRVLFDHEVGIWAIWGPENLRWRRDKRQMVAQRCRELARHNIGPSLGAAGCVILGGDDVETRSTEVSDQIRRAKGM